MNKLLLLMTLLGLSFSLSAQLRLEVEGKVKVSQLDLNNTEDDVLIWLPDGTLGRRSANTIGTSPDNDWTVTGNNLTAQPSGNVGIGTTSPTAKLEVHGTTKFRGKLDLIQAVGDSSLFIGANAGMNDDGSLNENTFVGTNSGKTNTSGKRNSFFGWDAGYDNTTGHSNSFFGQDVGFNNTTGDSNSFFGRDAGNNNTTGDSNSFFGRDAGYNNTTGYFNAFFGRDAGYNNTTGQRNAFFGLSAGSDKNNTRSTMLGYNAETTDSLDRAIAIGHNAKVGCHNCAVIGGTGIEAVKVGIGTTTPTADLYIKQSEGTLFTPGTGGIIFEDAVNPAFKWQIAAGSGAITFAFVGATKAYINTSGDYVDVVPFRSPNEDSKSRSSNLGSMNKVLSKVKKLQPATKSLTNNRARQEAWGFDAEEVSKLFPAITPEEDGQKGIIYDYFGILSIKAIQELAADLEVQEEKNNNLKEENTTQNETIAVLEKQMNVQQAQITELKSLVEKLLNERVETPKNTPLILPLAQKAQLAQNQPNPFRENTLVDYVIPANVQQAHIQVTALDGKVIGKVAITQIGKGQVTIQSKNYPAGTYFYSLVLDGQVMETKRMVLAR